MKMDDSAPTPIRMPPCTCGEPACATIHKTADVMLIALQRLLPDLDTQLFVALTTTARLCVASNYDVNQICVLLIEQYQMLQHLYRDDGAEATLYPKGNA